MSLRMLSRQCVPLLLLGLLLSWPSLAAASFNNGTSFLLSTTSGNATILDPTTGETVAQGAASDGAGAGFDAPAALWVVFALVVGGGLNIGDTHAFTLAERDTRATCR